MRPPFIRHELIRVNEEVPGKRGRKAAFMKAIRMPVDESHSLKKTKELVTIENSQEEETKECGQKSRTSTAWVRAPTKGLNNATQNNTKTNGVAKKQNGARNCGTVKSGTARKRGAVSPPSPQENGISPPKRCGRPPKSSQSPSKLTAQAKPKKVTPLKVTPPKGTPRKVTPLKSTPLKVTPLKVRPLKETTHKMSSLKVMQAKGTNPNGTTPKVTPRKLTPEVLPKQRNGQEVRRSRRIRHSLGTDTEDADVPRDAKSNLDYCIPDVKIESENLTSCTTKHDICDAKIKDNHTGVSEKTYLKSGSEKECQMTNDTGVEIMEDIKTEDMVDEFMNLPNTSSQIDIGDVKKSTYKSPKTTPNSKSEHIESNYCSDNGVTPKVKEEGDHNGQRVSPGRRSIKLKLRVGKLIDTTKGSGDSKAVTQSKGAENMKIKLKTLPFDDDIVADDVSNTVTRVYEVLAVETGSIYDEKETLPSVSSNGTLSPLTPPQPRLSPQVAELSDHDYF